MDATEGDKNNKLCKIKIASNPKKGQENQKNKSKNSPNCTKNAFYYFQNFSESASIDGLKFLGEEGRTLSERIFWSIVISVAILLSIILVFQTFIKWINSPVIVTFATTQKPIYDIPFPAITICPESKTRKEEFNFTDVYLKKDDNKTLTPYEISAFDTLSIICGPEDDMINKTAIYTNEEDINLLAKLAFNVTDMVIEIKWKGIVIPVKSAFVPILTSEGVCYTFNGLDKSEIFSDDVNYPEGFFKSEMEESDWTIESGYDPGADIDAYPRRTFVAGIKGGLELSLKGQLSDLDYVCGDALQGFKVALHHPAEIPRIKQNYFRVPINQVVVVGVKPNIMTTAEELTNYTPEDRQCYFELEKKLRFFKIYNQRNCLLECLTNYTFYSCGCVDFQMPRENSTPICGIASQNCTEDAKVSFLTGEVSRKIEQYDEILVRTNVQKNLNDFEDDFDDQCDCLPSCHSIDFDVETSQSDWNWYEVIKILRETNEWSDEREDLYKELDIYVSMMMIYFKDMQFTTSERNELYGYTDFWANVGGIIGLFTGFSFITMFEILYYLSLRLTCNIKMFGRRFWSGSPKVLNEKCSSDEE